MSDTYTKLFSSITESTVWGEAYPTRIVWVTMLAMVDAQGDVYGSVPGLARRANVTVPECEAALAAFQAPDAYSRTKDDDGRRIREIPGGWHLINHGKYAAVRNAAERRDYKRDWDRSNRPSGHERAVRQQSDRSPTSPTVPTPPTPTPTLEEQEQKKGRAAPLVLPDWLPGEAWDDWHAYRNGRKGWTAKARQLSLRTLTELWAQGHDPRAVIEQSIERGWTGLFPVHGDRARAGPAGKPQQESKTLTGMKALQGMKPNGLVHERDHRRADQAHVLELGPDACRRLGSGHGGDVD